MSCPTTGDFNAARKTCERRAKGVSTFGKRARISSRRNFWPPTISSHPCSHPIPTYAMHTGCAIASICRCHSPCRQARGAMCVCHQWLRRARSRLIRHRYAPFVQRTHRLRLLHVRSLFRLIAMETGRAVLAGLRVRPLEKRGKFRPNRNRRGSPDQRRWAIQRRKTLRTRVSAVRTQSANPFENRRNSASDGQPERVRKGDSGGGGVRQVR